MKNFLSIQRVRLMGWLSGLALLLLAQGAFAGAADIASMPPATLTSSTVRPNLMFVLDDSGSMAWDYLPDNVTNNDGKACFGYSGYNGVFYNPSLTYKVPKNSDGTDFPAASFTAAKVDGFSSSSSVSNLSNPAYFSHYYVASGPTTTSVSCTSGAAGCTNSDITDSTGRETVVTFSCSRRTNICSSKTTTVYQYYYYTTLNSGAPNDCSDTHYAAVTSSTGWTAAQQQNYANWYQYYRTRIMMMKSAAGRVFDAIDPTRFRVGFSAISNTGVADGSKFLNIANFDAVVATNTTQKTKFFSTLYSQSVGGSTPLRPALIKMGQYFAHKASSQTVDPMQYSCQRNFTLLSTDGYWNTGGEPSSYIPKRLDGTTAIGDVDGVTGVQRPQYDASQAKNSLADIAKYFYDTDIRTTALGNCTGSVANQDVCANKLSSSGGVLAYQNMSTFTLGLGVPGVLNYTTDYDSATSGDFHDIVTGAKNWPDPLSSSVNGLADGGQTVTSRIDDLWHAAVNAGGRYYSARDPDQLVTGLTDALQKIDVISGSSSGAATSTLQPVVGDDWVFLPKYETKTWIGDIAAYHFSIDSTGVITIPSTPAWSAAAQLAAQSSRSIFFFDNTKSNKLNTFTYGNLSTTQKTYFDNLCQTGAFKLSQCAALTTNALAKVTGANVVAYLTGNRQYEMSQPLVDNEVFRTRTNQLGAWTPLGDVIDSAPVYVRVPPFKYADAGYSAFQTNQASRPGMVYVGTNDGMLHAFRSDTGAEQWAFVPSAVMSNMYALADIRYATSHRYFVDATPVVADVFDGNAWHTILISGLGAGGREYFALDITDPTNPQALWEFTDNNLGLSFGRPVVAKNKAGRWFVAFSSGYNNIGPGDGVGRLYVVDAMTGQQLTGSPIATSAGDTTTPSNLGQINAWVDTSANNTAARIYGGDMLGNIWRFDYDDNIPPSGPEAFLIGTAKGPSQLAQPITTPPLLFNAGTSDTPLPVVIVGTGRYLGQTDLGNTDVQSLYAVRDKLGTTTLGTSVAGLRGDTTMVRQQMNSTHVIPSPQPVDWSTNDGWYVDFDQSSGERINVEMDLQLGQITVATTVPSPTPCSPGGTSWLYYFWAGATTGTTTAAIPGTVAGAQKMDVMLVGVFDVLQSAGTDHEKMVTIWTGSDQSLGTKTGRNNDLQQNSPTGGTTPGAARRTSWRELVN